MAEIVTIRTKRRRTPEEQATGRPILTLNRAAPPTITTVTHCHQAIATRQHQRHQQNTVLDRAVLELKRMSASSPSKQRDTRRETREPLGVDVPAASHPGAPADTRTAKALIKSIRDSITHPQICYYDELAEHWPEVFSDELTPYPLSREAIRAVKNAAHDEKRPALIFELEQWTTAHRYLAAVKQPNAQAYHLDGTPAGPVPEREQQRAAWRIIAYTVIRKQHRRATR